MLKLHRSTAKELGKYQMALCLCGCVHVYISSFIIVCIAHTRAYKHKKYLWSKHSYIVRTYISKSTNVFLSCAFVILVLKVATQGSVG